MGDILAGIFTVVGLAWVGFMLVAMFRILRIAPKGQKMRTYNQLGMWNFGQIRTDLGAAVEPHLRTMRFGGYAFLIFFVIAAAVAIIAAVTSSANPVTL